MNTASLTGTAKAAGGAKIHPGIGRIGTDEDREAGHKRPPSARNRVVECGKEGGPYGIMDPENGIHGLTGEGNQTIMQFGQ